MPANGPGKRIQNAYMPYFRAFLKKPTVATLRFENTARRIRATAYVAQQDFNVLDGSVARRSELARAFGNLVREIDAARPSTIRFKARPAQVPNSLPW